MALEALKNTAYKFIKELFTWLSLFVLCVAFILLISISNSEQPKQEMMISKKLIVPDIAITFNKGKFDTTFIYKKP